MKFILHLEATEPPSEDIHLSKALIFCRQLNENNIPFTVDINNGGYIVVDKLIKEGISLAD